MSFQDRIARLEALLDRVRGRRSEPGRSVARNVPPSSTPMSTWTSVAAPLSTRSAPPEEPDAAPEITIEAGEAIEPTVHPAVSEMAASPERTSATFEVVETEPPESLGEDDLLEMSSDVLDSVPPGPVEPILASDLQYEDDEAPVSSERHKVSTLDEALAAEPVLDDGREVPIKTPPPESGPQEAVLPLGLGAPPAPDVDALLAADLSPISLGGGPGPTPEQLGQTIELEEPSGPELELGPLPLPSAVPPAPSEDLEVRLPTGQPVGSYAEDLAPPPEARAELEARLERAPRPLQHSPDNATLRAPGFGEARADREPELIERPPISGVTPIAVAHAEARKPRPETFAELLDASIALGG